MVTAKSIFLILHEDITSKQIRYVDGFDLNTKIDSIITAILKSTLVRTLITVTKKYKEVQSSFDTHAHTQTNIYIFLSDLLL